MSEEERLKDRAAGCMLGLAIGDALGAPYEFAGEGAAGAVAMRFLEWGGLPAGSYTDDTQMSIATAESILACGKLDVEDLARRFAGMAGEIRGIGTTTRLVLEKIRGGASAQHAAEATHLELGGKSAGNGAIMRIAPVAVAYWMDIPALDAAARAAAGIVHYDKVAQDAATAVAQVLAFLLSGATRIEQALATAEVLFMEKGREVALALRDGATARAGELKPGSAYVLDTLACVVWALLEGESYEECVRAAISLGGDTDTQAAVTGAVAGAAWGLEGIPEHLRGVERAEEIIRLAERLAELSLSAGPA